MKPDNVVPPVTVRFTGPARVECLEAMDGTKFIIANNWENIEVLEKDE